MRMGRVAMAVVALAIGIGGCGGGGDDGRRIVDQARKKLDKELSATTTASATADPQARAALETATTSLLTAEGEYASGLKAATASGFDLDAVKRSAARMRNALFTFDGTVRQIDMPVGARQALNALLTSLSSTIASFDDLGATNDIQVVPGVITRVNSDFKGVHTARTRLARLLGAPAAAGTAATTSASTAATTTAAPTAARFSAPDVAFSFDIPDGAEQVDADNGKVLAAVLLDEDDPDNGVKIRKASDKPLPVSSFIDRIRQQFREQLGTEIRQGSATVDGAPATVLRFHKRSGPLDVVSSNYFFTTGGAAWQVECISTRRETRAGLARLCRTAIQTMELG